MSKREVLQRVWVDQGIIVTECMEIDGSWTILLESASGLPLSGIQCHSYSINSSLQMAMIWTVLKLSWGDLWEHGGMGKLFNAVGCGCIYHCILWNLEIRSFLPFESIITRYVWLSLHCGPVNICTLLQIFYYLYIEWTLLSLTDIDHSTHYWINQ